MYHQYISLRGEFATDSAWRSKPYGIALVHSHLQPDVMVRGEKAPIGLGPGYRVYYGQEARR